MNFFFFHLLIMNRENEPDSHTRELQDSTNEGSEFLDDVIRTVDEPFMYHKLDAVTV